MSLYKIQSEQYFIALTILRNKTFGAAHDGSYRRFKLSSNLI